MLPIGCLYVSIGYFEVFFNALEAVSSRFQKWNFRSKNGTWTTLRVFSGVILGFTGHVRLEIVISSGNSIA